MATSANVRISFCVLVLLSISQATHSEGIDVENGVINVTLSPHSELCERVRVSGISRLKLGSYASVYRVALFPSVDIPERYHSKIQICFHQNASLGLCQCKKDEWKSVGKELWRSVMSPYEDRYVDVKFDREVSGSVTITVEEEFQRWRLFCLALGLILLVLAPIVSSWVPFYYGSSMAIGVFLVILILLFQGMKLLPTGRKNFFYLTIYGSVLGAGSFLLHHFSMFVNSILVNFGLSEEMHNPVSILVLVFIVLAGAALGYWIVRKFIISEDGSVDGGTAQFVKWAMRIIAITFIFQSTLDTPLAVGALVFCLAIYFLITSPQWHVLMYQSYFGDESSWSLKDKRATAKYKRAEFFSRSKNVGARGTLWNSPRSVSPWSNSPVKGLVSPSSGGGSTSRQDYYSSFHETPNRKKFSKKEWKEFTEESTRQAVSDWASSPEFADWIIKHADRIQVLPDESSDEMMGSGSDSTNEDAVESANNGVGIFKRI